MAEALFGTDGYRGQANDSQETGVNPTTFERLAYEYVNLVAEQSGQSPVVIVGSDTRESSPILREAACIGAASAGAEVWELGIAPTPVIAWAAQEHWVNAIAITASHNPGTDNGFKPFDVGGVKPTGEILHQVEKRYFASLENDKQYKRQNYQPLDRPDLKSEYLRHVVATIGGEDVLAGKMVVIDGAHGAAYELAPKLYQALGAEVVKFACSNDGIYINKGSGAAHLDGVTKFISDSDLAQYDNFLGAFASDGDGDRVMGVDQLGRIVDGNYWLGRLAIGQKGIVGTVYTNSALRRAVTGRGVEFHVCPNGDSHVTAKLKELTAQRGPGFARGGEFTGHLIDLDHLSSGDGLYMGAWLAREAALENISLAEIYDELKLWPEKLVNIQVKDAKEKVNDTAFQAAINTEQSILGDTGNVIVRVSGTEPLVRIWVEAENSDVNAITTRLAQALELV